VLTLPAPAPRNGEVILGVRAEHTGLSQAGATGWDMKVEALEMLGAERLVYGQVGGMLFTVRIDATETPPKIGDVVSLQATPEHLHWFDATSLQRL
jgi:sn-glycerol 3-phosphate transport system ATP-binding protein